jgi:zinc/manganese transport system substrate-binding protein
MKYFPQSFAMAMAFSIGLPSAPVIAPPAAKIAVVATTPDLGAIAKEIGGDMIEVKTLAKPTEDPHFVDAKPSLVVTLNRADMLIEGGAELEVGWLPPLLETARNDKLAAGAPGLVIASQGIRMLEVPATLDRSRGDVHAQGNPHFLLDPGNVKLVAAQIADHLGKIDPQRAIAYKQNLATFNNRVDVKSADWAKMLAPFKGAKIVTYHNDFIYFANRYGFQVVETLEPKPGIAPSAAHIAKVIQSMKSAGAKIVLVQPYQNRKTAETVARQADATVIDYSQQPGALKNTPTYFDLMDNMVKTIAAALQEKK